MRKRLIGMVIITTLITFGCNSVNNNVEASLPSSFTVVSQDKIDKGELYKVKEKETGCYYTYSISIYNDANAPVVTQMFVKENGVSVPYCE